MIFSLMPVLPSTVMLAAEARATSADAASGAAAHAAARPADTLQLTERPLLLAPSQDARGPGAAAIAAHFAWICGRRRSPPDRSDLGPHAVMDRVRKRKRSKPRPTSANR